MASTSVDPRRGLVTRSISDAENRQVPDQISKGLAKISKTGSLAYRCWKRSKSCEIRCYR